MVMAKPNRDEQTKPKLGKSWCMRCDMHRISQGQKCPMCGYIQTSKRRKKD